MVRTDPRRELAHQPLPRITSPVRRGLFIL